MAAPKHIPETLPLPQDAGAPAALPEGETQSAPVKGQLRALPDLAAQQQFLSPGGGAGGHAIPGGPVAAALPATAPAAAPSCQLGRPAGKVPVYEGPAVQQAGTEGVLLQLHGSLAWFETSMPAAAGAYRGLATNYNAARDYQGVAAKHYRTTLAAVGVEYRDGDASGARALKEAMETRSFRTTLAGIQAARDELKVHAETRLAHLEKAEQGTAMIRAAVERAGVARAARDEDTAQERLATAKGEQKAAVDAAKAAGTLVGDVITDTASVLIDPAGVPKAIAKWVGKGIGYAIGFGLGKALSGTYKQRVQTIQDHIVAIRARIDAGISGVESAEVAAGQRLVNEAVHKVAAVDLAIQGSWNKVTNGISLLAGDDKDGPNPESMDLLQTQVQETRAAGDRYLTAAAPVQAFLHAHPLSRAEHVRAVLERAKLRVDSDLSRARDPGEADALRPASSALALQLVYTDTVTSWRDCRRADVAAHMTEVNTGGHFESALAIIDQMGELTGIHRIADL